MSAKNVHSMLCRLTFLCIIPPYQSHTDIKLKKIYIIKIQHLIIKYHNCSGHKNARVLKYPVILILFIGNLILILILTYFE